MHQHRVVPSSQSTARRLAGVVAVVLLTALPTSVAAQPTPELVVANGLGVVAPDPGVGVAVTAVMVDGRSLDLVVETDLDGVTRVVGPATGTAALTDGVTAGKDACADGKHAEIGFRWTTPWRWRFRASSTPDGMAKATAEQQLRSAVRSITTARNDCGLPDRVSAKAVYLGRTSRKPGVRSTGACGKPDGQNVVGFGPLPQFVAGLTCTWYSIPLRGWGRAIESDVLINKRQSWATRLASCSVSANEIMLRAVATHEFGHVFGLGHVSEATHPNLTMSEAIGPCDDSAFTLGKGDVIGLERLY
jgi:hypothetical protein